MSADPLDARFEDVRRSLVAASVAAAQPASNSREHAAVALILRSHPGLELLLIKRSVSARDPWSGHMALPGGRWDSVDESLFDTAVREAREETGIVLASAVRLGHLSEVRPQGVRLPRISISPFVFGIEGSVETVLDPREVDSAHWVPVTTLADPTLHRTVEIPIRGRSRPFPAFLFAEEVVWGLTYRILSEFLSVLPADL